MNPADWIGLPFEGRYMVFNREKLTIAILEYMEASDKGLDSETILLKVSQRLSHQHGFVQNEAILYPIGAAICIDRGIDP